MSEKCIFCKIANKEAPASIIYEDAAIIAFMDIRPVSEGHALVIPKKHFADIFDTPPELLAEMHKVAKKISVAVQKSTHAEGISIVQQNGSAAGQDIFHIHVHVIPRFEGHKMPHFSDLLIAKREVLEQTAESIRKLL